MTFITKSCPSAEAPTSRHRPPHEQGAREGGTQRYSLVRGEDGCGNDCPAVRFPVANQIYLADVARMHLRGKTYIARHGETVFNASARLQGDHVHTPLTRVGFDQANAMGVALRDRLGAKPALALWSSTAGRALQTLAIIAEHLELDWHAACADDRLVEIGVGSWGGRSYADLTAEVGPIVDRATMLLKPAPDGESYPKIAARVSAWAADADSDDHGDRLVIMHGVSSRVLRGVLTGMPTDPALGAPIAPGLPQGSVVMIENGIETLVVEGTGGGHA